MRRRLAVALLVVAILLGVAAASLWAASQWGVGAVPMKPAPTVSPSTPTPTASPTAAPTSAPLQDIDGSPVHITVRQQDVPLVDADIDLIQLDADGWLYPQAGLAGWYGPPQWDTVPGNLSDYRAVIVGHNVTGSGEKDVFYNLGQVKAGDRVTITYALHAGGLTTAEFVVQGDAVAVPKQDVVSQATTTYRWVWRSDAPERVVSLFSCDLDAPHVDGHSVANWIISARRVG